MEIPFFHNRFGAVLALTVFSVTVLGAAELPPDTWEARHQVRELIMGPVATLVSARARVLDADRRKVQFSVERRGGSLFLLFLHEEAGAAGPGYPLLSPGNVSIKRSVQDGVLDYMTVLIRGDERSYLRLYPENDRTRLQVVLYGVTLHQHIMIPMPFERLLAAPMERIVDLTGSRVDWDLVFYAGYPEPDVRLMIDTIRGALPGLIDEEDGAYDALGRPVLIETGEPSGGGMNCSGFAKWVMDGLYQPLAGRYMSLARLKQKHLENRGTRWSDALEGDRDPYFGLDWSRNMASALQEALSGRPVTDPEVFDVRRVPYLSYVEDVGYPIDELELLMYLLASRDPGRFYLGSINKDFGQDPILHQHTHVVTLFPTFRDDGSFRLVVMERNLETGVQSLLSRYPGTHIHLVGVQADRRFAPLTLRSGG